MQRVGHLAVGQWKRLKRERDPEHTWDSNSLHVHGSVSDAPSTSCCVAWQHDNSTQHVCIFIREPCKKERCELRRGRVVWMMKTWIDELMMPEENPPLRWWRPSVKRRAKITKKIEEHKHVGEEKWERSEKKERRENVGGDKEAKRVKE